MAYFEGFVVPVPKAQQEPYRALAAGMAPLFHEFGALRLVEAWEEDVRDGQRTDFRRAVKAEPDEAIVFSWIEYPSREARDAANARMRSDERMKPGEMPFDTKRMIYGGFEVAAGDPPTRGGGYFDGMLVPVPSDGRDAYLATVEPMCAAIREHGALRLVEGWGNDVPDGKVTDFKGAVQAQDGETVVFSWIEWPDKATRNAAWGSLMNDPRLDGAGAAFGPRSVSGGFVPIVDLSR